MSDLIYAIGDIHGHLDKLQELHTRIEQDAAGRAHKIIHIGDLIDRGPDSRGVISYLMNGQSEGKDWEVLKGNHDTFLTKFARTLDPIDHEAPRIISWFDERVGGRETLASFGGTPEDSAESLAQLFPEDMITWLEELPIMRRFDNLVFAHAGINPDRALYAQREGDLLWIRDPFLEFQKPHGVLVVHGHTPTENVEHRGNRIAIDTGAGYGRKLSGIVIDGEMIYELEQGGRKALAPPKGWTLWGERANN